MIRKNEDILYLKKETPIEVIANFFKVKKEEVYALAKEGVGIIHYQINGIIREINKYYSLNLINSEIKCLGDKISRTK